MHVLLEWIEDAYHDFHTVHYGLLPSYVVNALISLAVLTAAAYFGGPLGFAVALLLPIIDISWLTFEHRRRSRNAPHKGRVVKKVGPARKAADKLRRQIDPTDQGILWGGVRIASEDAVKNWLLVGDIGAGKTLSFLVLMRDVLRRFRKGGNFRAVVYDSKRDYVDHLSRMDLKVPVVIMNPFDIRHVAWDIAKDIDSPIIAKDVSQELFPSNPRATHKFFEDAPQALGSSVLRVFIKKRPGRWTFRQFLLVMRDDELIRKIAGADEAADATVKRFLAMSGEGRGNVMATVTSKLAPYEEIASCWEKASYKLSLKEWLSPASSSVLILGNYEIARKSVDLVNKLYVNMIAKFALNLSDDEHRRNWFFFDEFTEAGEFTGVQNLILRGRSKGCCSVIGFQEIDALYGVYGENRGRSLVSQCGNKAFLRMSSEQTAKWASGVINDCIQAWEDVLGNEGGKSRSAFPPAYFMNLPPAGRIHGLHGVYLSPSGGCFSSRYTPAELNQLLGEAKKTDPSEKKAQTSAAFQLVPAEWQELAPWSEEDSRQFGISHQDEPDRRDEADDDLGDIDRCEL